ncbi:MAG: alpha/beta fold hydrolase [Thermoleophilia bacterium]|nr:alpha/beta fold hydrolase [Thermoleophilia bacterium]
MPRAANGLWYELAGSGEPVVLLHAGVADSRIWSPVFPLLAQRFQVVAYDQRAYGCSAAWRGPYSLADDLFGVMDDVGFDRACLVGLSRGGRIALEAALAEPDRVTRLVLVASALPGYTPSWDVPEALERRWEAAEAAGDYASMAELDLEVWAPIGVDDELRAMFHQNAEASNGDDPAVAPQPPAARRLGELRAPTLVVTADRDVPGMNEIGDVLEREIPGAERVVISAADHMVPWREPRQLAEALVAFLSAEVTPP